MILICILIVGPVTHSSKLRQKKQEQLSSLVRKDNYFLKKKYIKKLIFNILKKLIGSLVVFKIDWVTYGNILRYIP